MDSRVISSGVGAESSGSSSNTNDNGQKHKKGVQHIPPTIMPNALVTGTGGTSPGQQRRTDAISNSEQRRASLLPLDKRLAKHQNSQDEAMTEASNGTGAVSGSPALLQDVGLPLQRMDLNDSPTKSPSAIPSAGDPKTSQRPASGFGSGGGGFKRMVDWRSFFATVDRSYRTKPQICPSVTKKLTLDLLDVYFECNPQFDYLRVSNPRRVLTKPSKPVHNDGCDNEDWDYILFVNDILGAQEGQMYQILDVLGQGTFGQVVKCQNLKTKEVVAIKVIKNKPAYYNQSLVEVAILEMLNNKYDKEDKHHIVRMKDTFLFRSHLCIIFEMLSVNLYELIKQNQFRGLSTNLVRVFVSQILDALVVLQKCKIIHCDLKPENILLKNLESPTIKVIDFGSACHENQTIYTYIQSRFYRSPEVLLGLPYTSSIDMWSVGCIAAELFLGLPLFPGSSQYNQVKRIVDMLGVPPSYMCEKGKHSHDFFDKSIGSDGKSVYALKSMEVYMREQKCTEQPPKKYFSGDTLPEIVNAYPIMRKGLPAKDVEREMNNRRAFLDFVQGLLNLNPLERWSPWQAIQHPFITGETFTQPYSMVLKMARMAQTVPLAMSPGESIPAQGAAPIKSHISNVKFRRPRANTISSSKVQNVPPQLQRLVAMQQAHSSSRGPYHSGDRMNDASHSLDGMQEIPPSAIRKLSPQDPGTSSNSQVGARRLTPHDTSPLQRRKTNPNPHAPPQFGSKSSVNGSSPNTNDQLSSRGLNASDTQSSGSRVSSGDPFAEKRPLDPTSVAYQGYESQGAYGVQRSLSQNPMNQDVSQRFPQGASWSSSYTSFDQMSPYEMNSRHGPTGERPGLPSRIPSTATSAEWEMFDDLDNQNRSYAVSPNISVVGSQRSSRRSSMMDMPVDYGSSYHDAGTPSITPDQVYSNSYNPHSYMGRSPQYSGPFGQHQMAQAQQQQQSYPMHLDSHESNQRMSRRYSSRSTISIEQGGRLSEVGGMPPGVPGGVQPGFEDECRDQMNDMPFRQGPQAIPIANSQHSSPRGSLSAQGAYGSPRGSVYRSNSGSRRYSSGPNPQNQQSLSGEVNAQDIYVNPGADPFPVEQQYGYMPYIPPLDAKRHSVSVQPYSGAPEDPPGFQQHASNRRPRRATQHDTRPAPPYGTMPYSGSDQHHGQVPYHHIPENPFVNSHNPYQPHPGMATTSMPESVDHPHSFQYANNRRHSDAPTRGNSQLGREQFTADEFGAHPSDSQASNMDAYSTEQRN